MGKVAGNREKIEHHPLNVRKTTFKKILDISADRQKETQEKQTGDSIVSFLLEFHEQHKASVFHKDYETLVNQELKEMSQK